MHNHLNRSYDPTPIMDKSDATPRIGRKVSASSGRAVNMTMTVGDTSSNVQKENKGGNSFVAMLKQN
jgi:hypothetical protein